MSHRAQRIEYIRVEERIDVLEHWSSITAGASLPAMDLS
jgi:hypothetical protein